MANDEDDNDEDVADKEEPADTDANASEPAPKRGDDAKGAREAMILKGIIAAAILGGAAYLGWLYHRTLPGESCSQGWHCKIPNGAESAQCRNVAGRGNICVASCTKGSNEGCPDGFTCDQLIWDDGGTQTGWFCLPSKLSP